MTHDMNVPLQDLVCDDLLFVVRYLKEKHGADVFKFSADPQGRWVRLYLRRNLSARAWTDVRDQCANDPQIQFGREWCFCTHHNVSVYPLKYWWAERRVQQPVWVQVISLVFLLFSALILVAGGVFMFMEGLQQGNGRNIGIGAFSILFFGFSGYATVLDLLKLIRREDQIP
jgi:hypothetical protein